MAVDCSGAGSAQWRPWILSATLLSASAACYSNAALALHALRRDAGVLISRDDLQTSRNTSIQQQVVVPQARSRVSLACPISMYTARRAILTEIRISFVSSHSFQACREFQFPLWFLPSSELSGSHLLLRHPRVPSSHDASFSPFHTAGQMSDFPNELD